ncbi:hypothetical protein [Phorcysia thermohydrogeniphila]|uniref:GtrA-like protein n=1 Tax=Phorcysia thermohydrogeniphila TaxID=936138 RepID=A0A4R1G6U7_9BACT|nr:hypothetical protein [Phorcysia thermohydrogeniphila]TCK03464.1 hypothetical protein CLV27_1542 [Phorcysia thermohydrogeniphila]
MENSFLKAFAVYAYSFVLIFMFNSLVMVLMMKAGLPATAGTLFSYVSTPVVLYFTYRLAVTKFLSKPVDERKIPKAWLYQFIPFLIASVLSFQALAHLVKKPPVAVFIFLNVELLVIYITFKLSLQKVLLKEERNG